MIYKGCQKKIILLRDPSGKIFEEAYFILKDDVSPYMAETDMVREANRIIREATQGRGETPVRKERKRTFSFTNLIWMLVGFAAGAAVSFMIFTAL